ncbi:MAG: ABC transporter ATP-binding protein/permease [Oscillospiraceae bacterium]|jgi:ATP-binding cassette subfamily B protein|nr:ABC transporter ATP-binding protein/permease [Oscillospiraceae bacterium]
MSEKRDVSLPPVRGGGGMQRGKPVEKPKDMRGTLRRLWELCRGHGRGLGWIMLLSALASASSVFSPFIIGRAINSINGSVTATRIIALLAGLYVSDWLVRFVQQYFMASISQRLILHIRETLFGAMKSLPLRYFDRHRHGELMSRLTNDVDNISTTISDSLSQLMIYVFTIVGVLTIMLVSNVFLTLISCSTVILIFILTRVITVRTRKLYKQQQSLLGKLNGQIEESISGLSLVKAYSRESAMIREFEDYNEQYRHAATQAAIVSGYLMPLTTVINNLSYLTIAVVSGIMAARGTIDLGVISSFLLYSKQFSRPFVDIANIYNNFQSAVAGAERVFEIIDERPEPEDVPDAVPIERIRGDIALRNVTFGYDEENPVLKNVSLTVPAGTRVAIVGPTGAGKTTIINLLTRFYDVDGGEILLDGVDLRDYKLRDLRRAFGVVLQDTSLFGVSVRENIAYGSDGTTLGEVRDAAVTAGADSFISRLPREYETVLDGGGASLSQGERQLVTIARAVLVDAPILILDEATSSVDTMTEQKIRSAILKLTAGRTSFIIAHRLSTIRDSDVIVLIQDGKIAEQGSHSELMSLGGLYAEMYKTQTGN